MIMLIENSKLRTSLSLASFFLVALFCGNLKAQVSITNAAPTVSINFSSTTPTTAGTSPVSAFTGAGFSPNPNVAGRLNSNAWEVGGFTFGTLNFGGTQTLDSFGRGSVSSGVITPGIYAYTDLPATVANPTLMIQPGPSEFAPGYITLRVRNNGTQNLTQLQVSYNLFVRNDGDMSNSFNFSHSLDNIIFEEESSVNFVSPETADPLQWVLVDTAPSRMLFISGLNIAPGGFIYLRWSCQDVSGTGERDEFGLDDIQLTGTYGAPAPEINVSGIGVTILNNDTTPILSDGTQFASIGAPLSTLSTTISKTFQIQNLGGLPLNVSNVTITGLHPTDFTIFGAVPNGNIAEVVGGVVSFLELTIIFDPSAAGLRRAIVTITSNDSNENPYIFHINGYGFDPVPEIDLVGNTGGTGVITDGSLIPNLGNNTLYANQEVGVTTQLKDFRIRSTGTKVLTLTDPSPYITISGANPGDFILETFPNTGVISVGFFKTFSIRFNPTAPGIRTAIVSIANDDSNENPYNFLIQGTGITPEIDISGNGQPIVDGSTVPTFVNDTFFDNLNIGSSTDRVFTIQNTGSAVLNLTGMTITGSAGSEYSIISSPPASIAIGGTASFIIRFSPTSVGIKDALVTITNNDINENPFTFAISGYGVNYTSCDFGAIETIAIQDFEATPATPTWNYSNTGTVTVGGGVAYAVNGDTGLTNRFIGARSLQVTNSTVNLTMSGINTSLFNDVQLSVNLAAMSTAVNNGMDLTDRVTVQVSTNGGTTWSNEVQVNGNVNSVWSFVSGIASAFKIYTGTNVVQTFNPVTVPSTTINYQTSEGYNSIVVSNLPKVANLLIRLVIVSNSQEVWAIDNITLFGRRELTSTWNGSAWSNGTPTNVIKAIIDGDYNTAVNGPLSACKCDINTGRLVTVEPNTTMLVESDLRNNGLLIIENNGSLVQRNDFAVNSGNLVVKRQTTPMRAYDYTYWSSPVGNQSLIGVSSQTSWDRFYSFSPSLGNWVNESVTNIMSPGKGYIIRAPDTFTNTPAVFSTQFSGTINNGFIQTPIVSSLSEWNLIGNPYPSAIEADMLLGFGANTPIVGGTIYLWTHNTPISSTFSYTSNDYAVYNLLGGVGTQATNLGVNNSVPTGKIAAGQGFFIRGLVPSGNVTFNNSMRVMNNNNQFFRLADSSTYPNGFMEKHRIWLNLTNSQGAFKQALIGYVENATNELDRDFDGTTLSGGNSINFYSLCNNQILSIQGRALPFNTNDVIPLGFSSNVGGVYSISIDNLDGLFLNQDIILEDVLLNQFHNLKNGPYTFNTANGTHDNRFRLRFDTSLLGTVNYNQNQNLFLSLNESYISLNSNFVNIKKISVYDMLGREVYNSKLVNRLEFKFLKPLHHQACIVKVEMEDQTIVTKKVLID